MAIQKVEYYLNGQVHQIPLDSGRTYRKRSTPPGKHRGVKKIINTRLS